MGALLPGARLGSYEIIAPIGAGGMGEVYRATDSHLKRSVAIKVLPASVAGDADRLARFQREAEVLAALNHPNIAAIYGLEKTPDLTALVMELVEGEDLSAHIARGPIALADALPIAKQIADALEAAHEQGIVHRDLKPANVKVRPDGTVKVLDFGLAKAMDPAGASGTDAMNSPTLTNRATQVGMIIGTAAYMAPEQAKGKSVDKRADIWAFGVVLYEMLTGRRAFEGEDISTTLAAVLMRDPDYGALPANLPAPLDSLIRRCLERDPKARLRDIGEARLLLSNPQAMSGTPASTMSAPPSKGRDRAAWVFAAALGVIALVMTIIAVRHVREAPAVMDTIQFTISSPDNSFFFGQTPQMAMSPDGRHVVFVASLQTASASVLWVRPTGSLAARPIPGTEQATYPFWSADSQFIGFFANGKLKKVQVNGGAPVALCDAPQGRGGTWNADNVILFAPSTDGPIMRTTSAGVAPTPVTDAESARATHRWPSFLPDGKRFLFFTANGASGSIRLGSIDAKDSTEIVGSDTNAIYGASHILFSRGGNLMAMPFDAASGRATGDPSPVADQVSADNGFYASFSLSSTGTLAYSRGRARPISKLTWFDRAGTVLGTVGDPAEYFNVALSPDERRVAMSISSGSPANRDLWLLDLARDGAPMRFTFDPAQDGTPAWSPNGDQVAFSSNRNGPWNLYLKAAGGGEEALLAKSPTTNTLTDWSRDGRFLAYVNLDSSTGADLWVLPLSGDRTPVPFLQTTFNEDNPVFSPDGRWIAYDSNESGTLQVYVRPFPAGSGQYMVSRNGGQQPTWRSDGQELFFLAPDSTLMAAKISTAKGFEPGMPETLFPSGGAFTSLRRQYAVAKDGKRFLVNVPVQRTSPASIVVIVNWQAEIKK